MQKYIYKYISFAKFVDMIQTQALTFVLPIIWEDVKENSYLFSWIEKQDQDISGFYAQILADRTFAQSWTSLAESDAMWRIYSYEKQSLRIKVDTEKIKSLTGVIAEPVIYEDRYIDYNGSGLSNDEIFLKLIAQKRTAFSHEEIRLIYVDVPEKEKLSKSLVSLKITRNILNKNPDFDSSNVDIKKVVNELGYLNINHAKKCHAVSFSHITDFISGVLVNPLASSWYVDTVKRYCELNSIPFEGKSRLYEKK